MIQVRNALVTDAPVIRQLAEEIWYPTYSPILSLEQIRYMLDHIYDLSTISRQITEKQQYYLLLLEDGVPVGFASFGPREENTAIYKLHKLYCQITTKGKGYGKRLIEEVEKIVQNRGCNTLELNVNKYNPAKGFYEKMGFHIIHEEDIPIGDYWMNDYVMRKELL